METGNIINVPRIGEIKLIAGPFRNYVEMIDNQTIPGYHSHDCSSCGTKWIHGDQNAGDVKEHTCPVCGKTMPLTLGSVQSSDGTTSWKPGWAKAGVIMPDGTERKVMPPVQIQNQPSQLLLHVQFYVTIILVSAMVATGVFYGMRWLEKQEIK